MDFERQYSIQEVEEQTNVPSATLRQWERRYHFPQPQRSDNGYRLYSPEDLNNVEAMKAYIENGMPASRAAKLVQHQMSKSKTQPSSLESLCEQLTEAFLDLSETKASQVLSKAHAMHASNDVLIHVMQKAVVSLGILWHKGQLDIATEHFASNFVQARLRSLLNSQAEHEDSDSIIISCAPLEQHELGALMMAVMLRQSAYHVIYLGADTPLKDLSELSKRLRPVAVLISSTTQESLEQLIKDQSYLKGLAPVVALGGIAFQNDSTDSLKDHTIIKGDAQEAVKALRRSIKQATLEPRKA